MAHPLNMIKGPAIIKPEDITIDDLRSMSNDSFPLWVLTTGIEMDGRKIEFDDHRYLLPIYADNSKELCWRKAAQLGATTYMLMRMIWWLYNNQGRKAIFYMPTQAAAENLSGDRLGPMIESCAPVKELGGSETSKMSLRKIGNSSLYVYHLGGVASRDSIAADFLAFDEVRLCDPKHIDQALERISHSPFKYKTFMSTCGHPNADIDIRYQYGTQHEWRCNCGCPDGVNLATTWPHCVVHDDPKRPGEVYYRCPKCRWTIKNPQNGRYIAQNPNADYNSYHVSQLISPHLSPKEAWKFFNTTTNISEFYNAKLGLPYIDSENRGVTMDQLNSNIDNNLSWGSDKGTTAMGIDQGAGYCYVTICDFNADKTKKRIRHIEVIEQGNPKYHKNGVVFSPFDRCLELMEEYNVRICVCDALPNYNDAIRFAQTKPGRIFLAYYSHEAKEAVIWQDKIKHKPGVQKAGPVLKFKYVAQLGRFASLSMTLGDLAAGEFTYPNPDAIVQIMRDEKTGVLVPESPCRRLFKHSVCLIKKYEEINEEESKGRWTWIHTGPDHAIHSLNYCNMALHRLQRNMLFAFA